MTSASGGAEGDAPAVGQPAPAFELTDQHGQSVALRDFRGQRNVLVVFYPFALSGTCTAELGEIRDDLPAFQNDAVQVLGVSCDPMYAQRAWAEQEGYTFPLLSDFWPHGQVARAYGVLDERSGSANRGTFLIDRDGVLRWSVASGRGQARDPQGYRQALAAL